MPRPLIDLPVRFHQAFNERDWDVWREVFDPDVELVIDGLVLRGVDAAVGYGVSSVARTPALYIDAERIVAVDGDTVIAEVDLVNGDPASGRVRRQGTTCEICRVRDGRIVSCRSYYMAEPGDRDDAVRVPVRAEAASMAEEQAALRRVATLIARGVSQAELFAAVNEEVGWLVGADPTSLMRFEPGDEVRLVAAWSAGEDAFPIGSSQRADEVLRSIRDTGRTWRWGPAELPASGPFVAEARRLGIRAAIGVPVVVEGRVWGVAFASSTSERGLAEDAEERIAGFAELVATAIATAQARGDLSVLLHEQAALRRVATLVARGVPPDTLFAAVTEEVGRHLDADLAGMIRFLPDGMILPVATWAAAGEHPPVDGAWSLEGDRLATTIATTGRPAREDDWEAVRGPIARFVREQLGIRSSVGSPIVVEGRVWGALFVHATTSEPLEGATESRLGNFTELVATAMANAQARADADRLAEEQAALRRVATLVARERPPASVFAAVAEEVGRLLRVEDTRIIRYEPDGTVTVEASWGRLATKIPVGSQWTMDGECVSTRVLRTGRPARLDDYDASWDARRPGGAIAERVQARGIRSTVGTPIVVEGRLWGAMLAGSLTAGRLPADSELRIGEFTELVVTAISKIEARADADRLAEEQAALRRVATLVASEPSPDAIFAAVAEELGQLLGIEDVRMVRFEGDETATVVASWGRLARDLPGGTRISLEGMSTTAFVFRTGEAARIDDFSGAEGDFAAELRRLGVRSAVSAPIVVDGQLWGAMSTASLQGEPIPADTEARMRQFTELVAIAISNTQARTDLAASRARIVGAADDERRRVVRDLHDGAQQRLVHTVVTLQFAQQAFEEDPGAARTQVAEALEHAKQATHELRELSHGIMPGVLTQGGLRTATQALAMRSPVPVHLDVEVGRLPAAIEATAYFVVAEALTNVSKHAHANAASVTARVEDGTLRVAVRDDGIGGAHAAGSGLLGLRDRLAVLNGQLRVESPDDRGTVVTAEIPLT